LGETLRRLHGLAVPPGLSSLWDPLGRVEQRLTAYAARADARADYVACLSEAIALARAELPRVESALGVGLVHGDPLNVIVTAEGPLLIDFDLAGIGPAAWDLVSVAMRAHRFGGERSAFYDFAEAYGDDVLRYAPAAPLLSIRELLDCSFALSLVGSDPAAPGELDIRMRAWLSRDDRSRWHPLPSSAAAAGPSCR
jgi:aminoglycoside phosphotransferase (APT) family kinase protein